MKKIGRLYDEIRAYKRSRVISTAIHLGILSALRSYDSGALEGDLQNDLSLSREWLHPVLKVLIKSGIVAKSENRYFLTELGIEAESDSTLRSFAGYHFHCFESWGYLPEAMKSGNGGDFHRNRLHDRDFCRAYLMSMDNIAQSNLTFLELECKDALRGKVLDIGAGPSSLCRRLAELNDSLAVTALDLPEVVTTARELFETPRNFEWIGQDFLQWENPRRFDAIFCSHLIEYCPKAELPTWLSKFQSFLKETGHIVLVTFLRQHHGDDTESLDLYEISTGLNGGHLGYLQTEEEIRNALTDAGFSNIEIQPVPNGPSYSEYLIIGKFHS